MSSVEKDDLVRTPLVKRVGGALMILVEIIAKDSWAFYLMITAYAAT
jgi:hypothetical protein